MSLFAKGRGSIESLKFWKGGRFIDGLVGGGDLRLRVVDFPVIEHMNTAAESKDNKCRTRFALS